MDQYVVILGSPHEPHAKTVYHEIQKRGVRAEFWDTSRFPNLDCLSLSPERNEFTLAMHSGLVLRAEQIHAIYWRNFNGINKNMAQLIGHHDQARIAGKDSESLLHSFLDTLPVKWVNGYKGFKQHQLKPACLIIASNLGLNIPETVITNNPEDVKAFCKEHEKVIFKPVQGGAHARRISIDTITDANLESLRYSPVTLQREIEGTNVRVFVFGDKTLACEINSPELDFRDSTSNQIIPLEISDTIANQSIKIANALNLVWSGIDYRVSPSGDFYFLEANPSPMFLGFERLSGLPLKDNLVELLLEGIS